MLEWSALAGAVPPDRREHDEDRREPPHPSAELAERLGISRQTVPVHVRNIYRKLEASNRSEAVFEATRLGLIRL